MLLSSRLGVLTSAWLRYSGNLGAADIDGVQRNSATIKIELILSTGMILLRSSYSNGMRGKIIFLRLP